jgi:hypothetical protein
MQAVILIGALAEGALLTLLQLPAAASPLWLPLLAGAWALLFPIALLLQVTVGLCGLNLLQWASSCCSHAGSSCVIIFCSWAQRCVPKYLIC